MCMNLVNECKNILVAKFFSDLVNTFAAVNQ